MFREFVRRVDAPVLANMTEFGKTPSFTAAEFESFGCKLVIWPVSALRMAAKAQERLYRALARDGAVGNLIGEMQTRSELYAAIDYAGFEALDASIVASALPVTGKQ
jgi:methylisocitrate lyase